MMTFDASPSVPGLSVPVLACSTRGLAERVGGARAALRWIAERGLRSVTLDATDRELRPRLLDRPARRELAAVLKRLELVCAGVDLLIPAEHFDDPQHADRAVSAAGDAIGLASEFRSLGAGVSEPVVALAMGVDPVAGVIEAVVSRAERDGVIVAALSTGVPGLRGAMELGVLARSGVEASARVIEMGARLGQVRIDRFDRQTLSTVPACVAAMSVASPGAIGVADLTDCADPERALAAALRSWTGPMTAEG